MSTRPAQSASSVAHLLVAAPLVAALALAATMGLGGAAGVGPFQPDPPRNVSEALAVSDVATAVWMFRTGADPAAVYTVRPELISSGLDTQVRPLAAAVYTGNDFIVAIALREGATLPPDEAGPLACRLESRDRETVARMVAPPGWTAGSCRPAAEERHK